MFLRESFDHSLPLRPSRLRGEKSFAFNISGYLRLLLALGAVCPRLTNRRAGGER